MRILSFIIGLGAALLASDIDAAQWARTYGGAGDDYASAVEVTTDGGYIVAGFTNSFGAGGFDAWLLRLDAAGNILWQKVYGGSTHDFSRAAVQTPDGGFLVAGHSSGPGSDGFPFYSWVLKLDAGGNLVREDRYAGTESYHLNAVLPTVDGGYVAAGESHLFPATGKVWLLKADSAGSVVWQRVLGGGADDRAYSLHPTPDGGHVVGGTMTGKARVIKLDSGGNVTWQRVLASPGGGSNSFLALQPAGDGDYVLGGPPGTFDSGNGAAVVKLDARGNLRWQKAYGGSAALDAATAVQPTADGGIVVAGTTRSFGAGQEDVWLFKLSASGDILWQRTFGGAAEERANAVRASSDGGFIIAGDTQSFGAGRADVWLLKVEPSGAITGCIVMGGSNAAVAEGNATTVDIPTLLVPRSATPANPNANFARSTGVSDRQCYFDAPLPVATTIPTLSAWALSLLYSLLVFVGAVVLWRRDPKAAKA